jgi:hypothetical protein
MFSQPRSASSWFKYLAYLIGAVIIATAIWIFTRPALPVVPLVKVARGVVEATVSNTRAGAVKASASKPIKCCWNYGTTICRRSNSW